MTVHTGLLGALAQPFLVNALVAAYYSPYPIGFYVTTFAFAAYVLTRLGRIVGRTQEGRAAA